MKSLKLNISINLESITKAVEESKTLDDNELLFAQLSSFALDRKQVDAFNEAFEEVERMVKQVINDKAKALYGSHWKAISGTGYKITRSNTGSTYEISEPEKVEDSFLKVKFSVNSREVENYIKANSKLPEGLIYNPNRSESIRIKIENDDKA